MYWVCVYSLSYSERNAHALRYIAICVLSGSTVFVHIILYTALFSEKSEYKMAFWFYLQYLSQTFYVLRRLKRDFITYIHRSSLSFVLFLQDFIKI
jgi:hypothetical protein